MAYGVSIDIDAVQCADTGHKWTEVFYGRATFGQLKGLPVRIVCCDECNSSRLDHLTWSGKVTSRVYDLEDSYIDNARKLGDYPERRMAMRRAKAVRMKKEGDRGARTIES
jgi:hypothetical protein